MQNGNFPLYKRLKEPQVPSSGTHTLGRMEIIRLSQAHVVTCFQSRTIPTKKVQKALCSPPPPANNSLCVEVV